MTWLIDLKPTIMNKLLYLFIALLCNGLSTNQCSTFTLRKDSAVLTSKVFKVANLTIIPPSKYSLSNDAASDYTLINKDYTKCYISGVGHLTNNVNPFSRLGHIKYTPVLNLKVLLKIC